MKKSNLFLSIILILCLNQCLVERQPIKPVERSVEKLQISIDPRMELLSTIQLLSNYPEISRNTSYSKEILNYFEPFSSQEAIIITDSLRQKYDFSFDAPVAFMLYLSQPPELEQQFAFSDYLLRRSGRGNNLEYYRKSIKQFAETSNFETFWNNKIPFYNQILDLTIADIGEIDLIKVLEDYFNETFESYHITISPSFIGGYAHNITDADGNTTIYGCLTTTDIKNEIEYMSRMRLCEFVWHEFGHSFVNPQTDKFSDRVNSLNKLFEPIKEEMSEMAYPVWYLCVNEHIIRAIVIRLYELHLDSQQSKTLLERELQQHFIYIEPLIEKLKDFEIQRDKNRVTFTKYYPELLNVLDGLQP